MAHYVFIAVSVATFFATTLLEAAQKDPKELAFLQKLTQAHMADIALGQLALKRASHQAVKQFGAEMVKDHQYANQEIRELSGKEGIYLPVQLDDKHKHDQQRLSRLSGKEFDAAFMAYLIKNHRKDLKEFETMVQNEKVKQWASATLPILEVHLKKAESVADALR